jgi:hypothetical protein
MDWVNAYQTIHNWRNGNKYNDATDQEIAIGFTTEKKNNKWYHVGHPSISELFFSNIAEGTFTNPNSIMFNTACQSLMGDEGEHSFSFAEQFTKRNLGVYLGYDESNEEGKIAGYHLFESMLNGMSLHQALSKLSEEERHDNMTETEKVNGEEVTRKFIANLRIYPENNPDALQLFLYPSYTEPVDNKTVTSSYEANHFIEVVGYTTTLDPKVLTYGFEYDTNALFTSPRQATKVTYTKLTEPSNKGNVQFKGRLTELEPDQIYYFRAYTYDGENYNYGLDQYVKYGKLSNLALSTDAVELLPGTQGVVEITSGNGVYDIDNSKETVASVKLVGNKIIIDALSSGKTIITITDTKSTQSTAITVTVWEKLSVAIIGNIDLEVGDRANVRILSGNNDYTLESSNPKVAMPTLVGEFVSVEALSVGTATITVTDNKTDQTANFTVTVTQNLHLSATKLSLVEGNSGTVEITAGSGEYGVTNLNSDKAKATLQGTTITIEALAVGEAKVVVTDMKTGQKIIIEVTVTQKTTYPDIALSTQEIHLNVGEIGQIEITSGSGNYTTWIYDTKVAELSLNGNIVTVKALALGRSVARITDNTTNKFVDFGIVVEEPSAYDKYAVDLGLSVKWAKMNVGAVSIEDCGEHYAWGETESKSYFSWSSYDYCNGNESTITKYNAHDGKTTLEPSDDAATVIMGRNWRTPTLTEMEELVNRCQWTPETLNGVNGVRVTGPNGNSIFLPYGGEMFDDVLSHDGAVGYYYASTLSSEGEKYAPALVCLGNKPEFVNYARYYGLSIRPVFNKK